MKPFLFNVKQVGQFSYEVLWIHKYSLLFYFALLADELFWWHIILRICCLDKKDHLMKNFLKCFNTPPPPKKKNQQHNRDIFNFQKSSLSSSWVPFTVLAHSKAHPRLWTHPPFLLRFNYYSLAFKQFDYQPTPSFVSFTAKGPWAFEWASTVLYIYCQYGHLSY